MKNFKLLLATTAILYTGLTANVWASSSTAPQSLTADFTASINIVEPATITGGSITFPTITTTGTGKVVVNPDGTVDESSDAQFTAANPIGNISPIIISGADVGSMYDDFQNPTATWDIADYATWSNITMPTTITLTDISNNAKEGSCGTVKNFVPGTPSFGTGSGGVRVVRFTYGATFEMTPGFHPNNGYARCEGSAEVTYIPYQY